MGYSEYLLNILNTGQIPNKSGYTVYTRQKTVVQTDPLSEDAILVTTRYFETLLYQSCVKRLKEFARNKENKNVFALTIYIDTEGGFHGLSINTEEAFRKSVQERYGDYGEEELIQLYGIKYNEGDFGYRFYDKEFFSPELEEVMNAYYSISNDHPITEISQDIAFENSFFREQMILCGIQVLKRLKQSLKILDTTEDFIAFVCLHDVDGEVVKTLMRQTNSLETLKRLFLKYF